MDHKGLLAGTALIIKDFQLEQNSFEFDHGNVSVEEILTRLTQIVDYLISNDFNKLLNALYRIDVSEDRLKATLANNPENAAHVIAQMILERELQKVESRKRYSA